MMSSDSVSQEILAKADEARTLLLEIKMLRNRLPPQTATAVSEVTRYSNAAEEALLNLQVALVKKRRKPKA